MKRKAMSLAAVVAAIMMVVAVAVAVAVAGGSTRVWPAAEPLPLVGVPNQTYFKSPVPRWDESGRIDRSRGRYFFGKPGGSKGTDLITRDQTALALMRTQDDVDRKIKAVVEGKLAKGAAKDKASAWFWPALIVVLIVAIGGYFFPRHKAGTGGDDPASAMLRSTIFRHEERIADLEKEGRGALPALESMPERIAGLEDRMTAAGCEIEDLKARSVPTSGSDTTTLNTAVETARLEAERAGAAADRAEAEANRAKSEADRAAAEARKIAAFNASKDEVLKQLEGLADRVSMHSTQLAKQGGRIGDIEEELEEAIPEIQRIIEKLAAAAS